MKKKLYTPENNPQKSLFKVIIKSTEPPEEKYRQHWKQGKDGIWYCRVFLKVEEKRAVPKLDSGLIISSKHKPSASEVVLASSFKSASEYLSWGTRVGDLALDLSYADEGKLERTILFHAGKWVAAESLSRVVGMLSIALIGMSGIPVTGPVIITAAVANMILTSLAVDFIYTRPVKFILNEPSQIQTEPVPSRQSPGLLMELAIEFVDHRGFIPVYTLSEAEKPAMLKNLFGYLDDQVRTFLNVPSRVQTEPVPWRHSPSFLKELAKDFIDHRRFIPVYTLEEAEKLIMAKNLFGHLDYRKPVQDGPFIRLLPEASTLYTPSFPEPVDSQIRVGVISHDRNIRSSSANYDCTNGLHTRNNSSTCENNWGVIYYPDSVMFGTEVIRRFDTTREGVALVGGVVVAVVAVVAVYHFARELIEWINLPPEKKYQYYLETCSDALRQHQKRAYDTNQKLKFWEWALTDQQFQHKTLHKLNHKIMEYGHPEELKAFNFLFRNHKDELINLLTNTQADQIPGEMVSLFDKKLKPLYQRCRKAILTGEGIEQARHEVGKLVKEDYDNPLAFLFQAKLEKHKNGKLALASAKMAVDKAPEKTKQYYQKEYVRLSIVLNANPKRAFNEFNKIDQNERYGSYGLECADKLLHEDGQVEKAKLLYEFLIEHGVNETTKHEAAIGRAKIAEREQNYTDMEKFYAKAVPLTQYNINSCEKLAEAKYRLGKISEAEVEYEALAFSRTSANPLVKANALRMLSVIERSRNNISKAEALLTEAKKHAPNDMTIVAELGRIKAELGNYDEAIEHYTDSMGLIEREILQLNSKNDTADVSENKMKMMRNALANLQLERAIAKLQIEDLKGQGESEIEALTQDVTALDIVKANAYEVLASLAGEKQKTDQVKDFLLKARATFLDIKKHSPEDGNVLLSLAKVSIKLGEYAQAIDAYTDCVELLEKQLTAEKSTNSTENIKTLSNQLDQIKFQRAITKIQTEDQKASGENDLKTLCEQPGVDAALKVNAYKIRASLMQDDHSDKDSEKRVLELLNQAHQLASGDIELGASIASLNAKLGDHEAAVRMYATCIDALCEEIATLETMAEDQSQKSDLLIIKKADLENLRYASAVSIAQIEGREREASKILFQIGRDCSVDKVLRSKALCARAKIFLKDKMQNRAIHILNKAVLLDTSNQEAFEWLAHCYLEKECYESARVAYNQIYSTSHDPIAAVKEAYMLFKLGDQNGASEKLDEIKRLDSIDSDVETAIRSVEQIMSKTQSYQESALLLKSVQLLFMGLSYALRKERGEDYLKKGILLLETVLNLGVAEVILEKSYEDSFKKIAELNNNLLFTSENTDIANQASSENKWKKLSTWEALLTYTNIALKLYQGADRYLGEQEKYRKAWNVLRPVGTFSAAVSVGVSVARMGILTVRGGAQIKGVMMGRAGIESIKNLSHLKVAAKNLKSSFSSFSEFGKLAKDMKPGFAQLGGAALMGAGVLDMAIDFALDKHHQYGGQLPDSHEFHLARSGLKTVASPWLQIGIPLLILAGPEGWAIAALISAASFKCNYDDAWCDTKFKNIENLIQQRQFDCAEKLFLEIQNTSDYNQAKRYFLGLEKVDSKVESERIRSKDRNLWKEKCPPGDHLILSERIRSKDRNLWKEKCPPEDHLILYLKTKLARINLYIVQQRWKSAYNSTMKYFISERASFFDERSHLDEIRFSAYLSLIRSALLRGDLKESTEWVKRTYTLFKKNRYQPVIESFDRQCCILDWSINAQSTGFQGVLDDIESILVKNTTRRFGVMDTLTADVFLKNEKSSLVSIKINAMMTSLSQQKGLSPEKLREKFNVIESYIRQQAFQPSSENKKIKASLLESVHLAVCQILSNEKRYSEVLGYLKDHFSLTSLSPSAKVTYLYTLVNFVLSAGKDEYYDQAKATLSECLKEDPARLEFIRMQRQLHQYKNQNVSAYELIIREIGILSQRKDAESKEALNDEKAKLEALRKEEVKAHDQRILLKKRIDEVHQSLAKDLRRTVKQFQKEVNPLIRKVEVDFESVNVLLQHPRDGKRNQFFVNLASEKLKDLSAVTEKVSELLKAYQSNIKETDSGLDAFKGVIFDDNMRELKTSLSEGTQPYLQKLEHLLSQMRQLVSDNAPLLHNKSSAPKSNVCLFPEKKPMQSEGSLRQRRKPY